MLTLGGIAVAVMIVILMLFFNVRWRLLPLVVVLIGVIWAFGIAGYLGIPLTLVTIAGLPVMLGIGIDYAIQMHSRIEEEVIIDRSPHPIQAAARGLGPALLVVTFDAVFAFAAIQISQVPMIREFGWLLTVGIIAICVSSIINPLAALGIREYRSPTKGRDFSEGALGRLVVKLGSLPASSALILAVLSVAVFVVGSRAGAEAEARDRPDQLGRPGHPGHQGPPPHRGRGRRVLRARRVRAVRRPELALHRRGRHLRRRVHPRTDRPLRQGAAGRLVSIVATVSDLTDIPGAAHVSPTAADVAGGVGPGAGGHQGVDRSARRRRRSTSCS